MNSQLRKFPSTSSEQIHKSTEAGVSSALQVITGFQAPTPREGGADLCVPQPLPLLPQSADLSSNGFIVDEVRKVHGGSPGVILIEDAGTAGLCLLPLGHGQLVPRDALVRGPWSLSLSCCLIIMEGSQAHGPQLLSSSTPSL